MSGAAAQHIVVVDDEASAREMVGDYLRMHGFDVTLCDGGRSLRQAMASRRPDLIVLDLSLPYRDGVEVLHELKANEDTAQAPIVIVSSSAVQLSQEDRDLVNETVSKPFDIDRLMNVFRRALGDPEQDVPERTYGSGDTHLHSW